MHKINNVKYTTINIKNRASLTMTNAERHFETFKCIREGDFQSAMTMIMLGQDINSRDNNLTLIQTALISNNDSDRTETFINFLLDRKITLNSDSELLNPVYLAKSLKFSEKLITRLEQ